MIVKKTNNLQQIKAIIGIVVFVSFFGQMMVDFSTINLLSNALCIIGTLTCTRYCFDEKAIFLYPLSTLMILGFGLYHFILPPIITLIEFKPVIYNLIVPILTFVHSFVFLCSLIVGHFIYRKSKLAKSFNNFFTKIYTKAKVFAPINYSMIFLMGVIGILAKSYALLFNNYLQTSNDPLVKFMEGMSQFAFLPFLIFLPDLFPFYSSRVTKTQKLFLIIYTIPIIFLGFATNSRTFLFIGFAAVSITLFFLFVYSTFVVKLKPIHLIYTVLILIFVNNVISGIAFSLVGIRGTRESVSTVDLVYKTFDAILDPNVAKSGKFILTEKLEWDEVYINNPIFLRLCNMKFVDNIINMSTKVNEDIVGKLSTIELDKTISILPQPIINLLGVSVNKKYITSGSMGDFMHHIVNKNEYALQGFRTGNLTGSMLILFGWYYPLVVIVIAFITFIVIDPFVKKNIIINNDNRNISIVFSPIAFLNFFFFCFYFTSAALGIESFSGLFSFLVRGWLQMTLIYFFLYYLTNMIVKTLKA